MHRLCAVAIYSFLIAGMFLVPLFGEVALADTPECGEWITHDIKLEANLYCDSEPFFDALVIGADGVTIDLNGYTIVGAGEQSGIYSGGFSNLTIKNGAITGFIHGILVGEGANVEIRQLTLTNQRSDSILVIASNNVEIKDVQISLPQTEPGSDITLIDVDGAMVKRVTAHGGFFGVLSIGSEGVSRNCKVEDSVFADIEHVGIRIVHNDGAILRNNRIFGLPECYSGIDVVGDGASTGIHILGNVITGCGWGIFEAPEGPSTRLQIQHNHVYQNIAGIYALGLTDSELIGNRVHLNEFSGIGLNEGSTGNRILNNTATGNGFTDMSHSEDSSPNLWRGNTCETSDEGVEVDCP